MIPASSFWLAVTDIVQGLRDAHMWLALGWQDVKQRYRRSALGPFWLTISTGIMVSIIGPLYGKLFNQQVGPYFAYLTVGFVFWQLVAQVSADVCTVFIGAEGYIKQVKLPLSVHVLRAVWKNIILFLHNMVIVVAVLAFIGVSIGPNIVLFPFGLLVFAANAFLFGLVFGVICARFRDIPIIVANIVQAAFFLTPVLWQPGMLGRHAWSVNFNPFYHFIEVVRAPLLGASVNPFSWPAVLGMTLAGAAASLAILTRYRARVPYWV